MRKLIGMWYMVFALVAIGNCVQLKQTFQPDEVKRCKSKCETEAYIMVAVTSPNCDQYSRSSSEYSSCVTRASISTRSVYYYKEICETRKKCNY